MQKMDLLLTIVQIIKSTTRGMFMNILILKFIAVCFMICVFYYIYLWARYIKNKSLVVSVKYFDSLLQPADDCVKMIVLPDEDVDIENVDFSSDDFVVYSSCKKLLQ